MSRNSGIDILRGLAAFGIVGCHLSLAPLSQGGSTTLSFCDCQVAIFAALAGYLMSGRHDGGWGGYVLRRAKRLLPVYAVWSLVFLVASAVFQYVGTGEVKSRYADVRWWLSVMFWGGAAAHLWFLISLFYAQSILWPFLPRVRKDLWVGVSFVLIVLTIPFDNWYALYPIRLLAFLLLGYGLSGAAAEWAGRRQSWLWAIVMVAVTVHFLKVPFAVGFLKDWVAAGPILLLFATSTALSAAGRIAVAFGATSMGVYLAHPLFTRCFSIPVGKLFATPYGVMPILLVWCASWGCSVVAVALAIRNKRLRRICS